MVGRQLLQLEKDCFVYLAHDIVSDSFAWNWDCLSEAKQVVVDLEDGEAEGSVL